MLGEYRLAVEEGSDVVTVCDLDGTVRDVNPAFERMTGYTCQELRTLAHWRDLTPPEFWDVTENALRDLAAAGLGTLKPLGIEPIAGDGACPVDVRIDAPDLCPGFALRLVRGVKNGPSPDWMQARLRALGLRPINALVDITNYLTFDRGRPLHVFDAAKVAGGLVVRRARDEARA